MNKLEILQEWASKISELDREIEKIQNLFNCCDCELINAMFYVAEAYTRAIAEKIGDTDGMMMWYWHENKMGESKMEAGVNGDLRMIVDLNDLLWVIDHER